MPKQHCLVLLGLCCALLGGCQHGPTLEEVAHANYGERPSDYQGVIKWYLAGVLKYPDSAQYAFWRGPSRIWRSGFGKTYFGYGICAGINARNSLGDYTGTQMHFFILHHNQVIYHLGGGGAVEESFAIDGCKYVKWNVGD